MSSTRCLWYNALRRLDMRLCFRASTNKDLRRTDKTMAVQSTTAARTRFAFLSNCSASAGISRP
jgi:hypothetical protein